MRTFKLLMVLLLLTPLLFATNSFSQPHTSQIITSSGLIVTPPISQNLLFQTDFSDITLGTDSNGRPNHFVYTDGSAFPFSSHVNYQTSSARVAIVNDASAMGGKVLELEVYPGMPTRDRCDVNLWIQDLGITDEFYVDSRLKLRSDYDLEPPHDYPIWSPWHEIIDVFSEWKASSYYYYMPLHVGMSGDNFTFALSLRYAHADLGTLETIWIESKTVQLPRGEFFHLRYYILRHPTNGAVKVWIDNTLVFDISGVPTMLNEDFFTTVEKVYGGEVLPEKKIWCDQIRIYDGVPA